MEVYISKQAKKKVMQARAGIKPLPKAKYIAFGDGGVSQANEILAIDLENPMLKNQLLKKQIETFDFPTETSCRYVVTLGKKELIGKKISEMALLDEENDIIGIVAFLPKYKDDDMEMTFEVTDILE